MPCPSYRDFPRVPSYGLKAAEIRLSFPEGYGLQPVHPENKTMGFTVCVRTEKKPQISPLRFAPVEMTNLLGYVRLCIDWKNHNLPETNLSSRPERSGVERSAVSF